MSKQYGGKSVRFNEGSQQRSSSRSRWEDERDSGLGSSSSEHTSHRRGRPDWGFTAADRHHQSNNPDALREAYATVFEENQILKSTVSKHEATLSTSHRTIKQLEGHVTGLNTEKDELAAKNTDYKNRINDYKAEINEYKIEIAKLRSENESFQRTNTDWQMEVIDLREQLFELSVVSDKMSGASGVSGATGTSGSSSNPLARKSSKRESKDTERLKDRFNRNTQNDGPVVPASVAQPNPQRPRRPSKVNTEGRPLYIEEPGSHSNLMTRPTPGHGQMWVPRSSQPSGDYQFHPLPEPSRRR